MDAAAPTFTSMLEHDEVRSARFWQWCKENPYFVPLCSGAFAGVASETLLFPLDCLKTRLQSRHGFIAAWLASIAPIGWKHQPQTTLMLKLCF
ncbi:PET8 [Symbiodinium sp. CCMP2592]|nr:PET8 [Symbiodinium sp. CCMP2592]